MRQPLLALIFIGCTNAVCADPAGQRGQMLEQQKAIESQSHQGRIQVLQQADTCIKDATTREGYRACEEREKAGREALRAQLQPQREAIQQQAQAMRQQRMAQRQQRQAERSVH